MADRAEYLARTLVDRIANLEDRFAEDGRGEPDRRQRIETIEKVLAVELGVTDSSTLALVESALPDAKTAGRGLEREFAGFAELLRQRLAAQLAEP